jgi:O-antigen ligase
MGSNSNGFAMFLLALFPFFIAYFFNQTSLLKRLLAAFLIFSVLMAVIKTRSRMGFVAIILQFGILLWANRKNAKYLLILSVLLLVPLSRAHENFWERVTTISEVEQEIDPDSAARQNKWRQALILIEKHPVTGVGLSAFPDAVDYYALGESKHIVHNAYLEIASETGVISLILFVSCIILTLKQMRNTTKAWIVPDKQKLLNVGKSLTLSFYSLAFCLIFLSEQYNSMFFLILGLCTVYTRIDFCYQNSAQKTEM